VNRKLTEKERDAIINGLAGVGFAVVDRGDRGAVVKKVGAMWTLTFALNNEQRSGMDVTF
jgi:hypothetical protein